jgi:bcr-type benzoyl-CoA reductase subunit C
MADIKTPLEKFQKRAVSPKEQLDAFVASGKKVIGCFPYYVPEELVHAAGMVPFGVWGAEGTPQKAKEYFATFYCTIAQMGLELALTGKLDKLSGVIMPCLCDVTRPLTQNFKAAVPQIPLIFLAHPQNRRPAYGVDYTVAQYSNVKESLEKISGAKITDDALRASIRVYNASRKARREFVRQACEHPEAVSAVARSAVLKSAFFMLKEEHTALVTELNAALSALPKSTWKGVKVVTSGILVDSVKLLSIFDELGIAIAADDVAQESRAIRQDAPETGSPMRALAEQFAAQDQDPILYDPAIDTRPPHVVNLVKKSGAKGVAVFMMTFCDPEELEYPSLKQALNAAEIPHVNIGFDQQMVDFGQARTQLETLREML